VKARYYGEDQGGMMLIRVNPDLHQPGHPQLIFIIAELFTFL